MDLNTRIEMLKRLHHNNAADIDEFYDVLEKCDVIKNNYTDYMTTHPVDCDVELSRLPNASYDLCCALLTMLLREDYFNNGSFKRRQQRGQVNVVLERMLAILESAIIADTKCFSEKALEALNGFYVYALADPRNDRIFYIGKGSENRVFSHEAEKGTSSNHEKRKLQTIREIEESGFCVKRWIVNWGLTESEAFASEATLINLLNFMPDIKLTNEVSGHHIHEALTTEEFELRYGAIPLEEKDIKHNILVIKINKRYQREMTDAQLYDAVRGFWRASLKTIEARNIRYVFGVYNGLIVAVYQPDEWHYGYELLDIPQREDITQENYEKIKSRVYFICKDYRHLDEEGRFYLHKSINRLKTNQSAQNPITYLSPER